MKWLISLEERNSLVLCKLKLEEYDFDVVYNKGKHITNVDALSLVELNPLKNESMIVNTGNLDVELGNIIKNVTLTEEYIRQLNKIIQFQQVVQKTKLTTLALKTLS